MLQELKCSCVFLLFLKNNLVKNMGKLKWYKSGYVYIVMIVIFSLISIFERKEYRNYNIPSSLMFEGEYKIGDGEWQQINSETHISANNGDVIFRGNFRYTDENNNAAGYLEKDKEIALYFNHLNVELYVNSELKFVAGIEGSKYGDEVCGRRWAVYHHEGNDGDPVEIIFRNPHKFGNNTAIDEFLDSIYIYEDHFFEQYLDREKKSENITGTIVLVTAMIVFGVAVFSTLMGLPQNKTMWLVGLTLLAAGGYCIFDSSTDFIWDRFIVFHTNGMIMCIMIYTLTLLNLLKNTLYEQFQKLGMIVLRITQAVTGFLMFAALIREVNLFDTLPVWATCTAILIVTMLICCLPSFRYIDRAKQTVLIVISVALMLVIFDIIANAFAFWNGGEASKVIFMLLYIIALITVFRVIPENIKVRMREKEMETELEKSKTAIMLSQIQPHFLYNSLSAIRELCSYNQEEAREALYVFTKYLRENMDSLKSEYPVHFSKELSHIETYLKLEKLRFRDDLQVKFDIQEHDFFIPSLTIQPLVENAVKHGICSREEGGTISISTRKINDEIIIIVEDDGVGFDTGKVFGSDSVGINNVRYRLKHIVKGDLQIESVPGKGTKATVKLHI